MPIVNIDQPLPFFEESHRKELERISKEYTAKNKRRRHKAQNRE